jgi:hypothetical protein
MGTRYTPVPADLYARPQVRDIPIPDFPGSDSIWGSTGRDSRGHIWIGGSATGTHKAAHLFEYAPETGTLVDRGDVISELMKAGVYREGEGQIKIHTKIVQADDGYLYFASTDEQGESAEAATPPKWGSHLWRLSLADDQWQHLYALPEGVTALAGNGRWIYVLGYWDHVLYQYDTQGGMLRKVHVGSIPGHVSRNFVVDGRGHAYVPRVRAWDAEEARQHPDEPFLAALVEFDTDLKEIGSTPLKYYYYARAKGGPGTHGLIGFCYLANGSILVTTSVG